MRAVEGEGSLAARDALVKDPSAAARVTTALVIVEVDVAASGAQTAVPEGDTPRRYISLLWHLV